MLEKRPKVFPFAFISTTTPWILLKSPGSSTFAKASLRYDKRLGYKHNERQRAQVGRNRQNRETLARLVEESQNGNREAFEELYRRTAQAQFYLMAHRVGYETANDLLQELYLIAWRNIRKIRPHAVLGYLGSVGRNLCRRHVERAAAAQRSIPLDVDTLESNGSGAEAADAPALHDANADPANLVTAADEHARLARALREELTDFERTCVVMRYYQGAKIDEIAEALDSSRNTVRRTLSRALMTLRTKMGLAPWGALGLSGALPQVVEKHMAQGARALERPRGGWSLATGAMGLAAVGVTAGAIAFAVLAPMPPASPATDTKPVTIEEAGVPASQTADTEPPALKSVTVEGDTTVLRLFDASEVCDVRCTSPDGTVHRTASHETDPGNSSDSLWRFHLPTGTYEAWAVDTAGNEAVGEITVEIYPDEPPPYEP